MGGSMITKLPGSKWWIETDDATGEIVATYNKANITADIAAIQETLLSYPDLTQEATDIDAIIKRIESAGWTEVKTNRIKELVMAMYQTFQSEPRQLETAQLKSKLDTLITLKERLI